MGKSGPGQQVIHAKNNQDSLAIYQCALPEPRIVEGYERVQTGAANRILTMAEREQENDHLLARSECRRITVLSICGQIFGFLLCLSAIGAAVFLLVHDKNTQGMVALISALVILMMSIVKSGK